MAPPPETDDSVLVHPLALKVLEDTADGLVEENASLRKEVEELRASIPGLQVALREAERRLAAAKALTGTLRSDHGDFLERATQVEAQEREDVDAWAVQERGLQQEVQDLNEERLYWCQGIERLRKHIDRCERELADSEEEAAQGVEERHRLQAECLRLQQQCEDIRFDLRGAEALLRDGGDLVETMGRQKLELEWTLQRHLQQHATMQQALHQMQGQLKVGAKQEQRQREHIERGRTCEIKRLREEAERLRVATLAKQRAVEETMNRRRQLEGVAETHAQAVSAQEARLLEAQETAEKERALEAAAKTGLAQAEARGQVLRQRLLELQDANERAVSESLKLQEDHARLTLERTTREAKRLIERYPGSAGASSTAEQRAAAAAAGAPPGPYATAPALARMQTLVHNLPRAGGGAGTGWAGALGPAGPPRRRPGPETGAQLLR